MKFLDGVRLPAGLVGISASGSASTISTTLTTPTAPAAHPFTDVPEGAYYHGAVLWALKNNITTGVMSTQF